MYDVTEQVAALDEAPSARAALHETPLYTFSGHQAEGFALDWSPVLPGRLVTGDCRQRIHLWNVTDGGGWAVQKAPFQGHTASVEDLQASRGGARPPRAGRWCWWRLRP